MIKYIIFAFILASNVYAYKDMSKVDKRAKELNMRTKDYAYAMAVSGALVGSMFGLFLWKSK